MIVIKSRPLVAALLSVLYFSLPQSSAAGRSNTPVTPICAPQAGPLIVESVPSEPGFDSWKVHGDNCHVHMFDFPEIRECMGDQWLIIMGGSNAFSTAGAALSMFSRLPPGTPRSEFLNCTLCTADKGVVGAFDAIFSKDGKVEWMRSPPDVNGEKETESARHDPEEYGLDPGINEGRSKWIWDTLREAPRPSPGAVRITWIFTRYFPAAQRIVSRAWETVPFMTAPLVHLNLGVWYSNCKKFPGAIGCPELSKVFQADGGDTKPLFRKHYARMLHDFRAYAPEMRVVVRNQAYTDRGYIPIYRDEFMALQQPHNISLLNWDFRAVSQETYSYVWDWLPAFKYHPPHSGSNILLQQHFNTFCPVPKVPVAESVITFPKIFPCVVEGEYYPGVQSAGCLASAYQVLDEHAVVKCPIGTEDTSIFDPLTAKWSVGMCKAASCPPGSSGAPNCKCDTGFTGELTWNSAQLKSGWKGECTLLTCPLNSHRDDQQKCQCDSLYAGELLWNGQAWVGTCDPVPCPQYSQSIDSTCSCKATFEGSIAWDESSKRWVGTCRDPSCPSNAYRNAAGSSECECAAGFSGLIKKAAKSSGNDNAIESSGSCHPVACPEGSRRFPSENVCSCQTGYLGELEFNTLTGKYSGDCYLASCPNVLDHSGSVLESFSSGPDCQCPSIGYASSLKWVPENTSMSSSTGLPAGWNGRCSVVFCPRGAVFANGVCACAPGYTGILTWDYEQPRWLGFCQVAPLPVHSLYADPTSYAAATCAAGYTGSVTWDQELSQWISSCESLQCPPDSTGDGVSCTCNELFEQRISFNISENAWKGECVQAKTIFPKRVFVVTGFHVVLGCCSALILIVGAMYRYTKWLQSITAANLRASSLAVHNYFQRLYEQCTRRYRYEPLQTDHDGEFGLDDRESTQHHVEVAIAEDTALLKRSTKDSSTEGNVVAPAVKSSAAGKSSSTKLSALGAARFLASVHVVAGHLVNRDPSQGYKWPTSPWGFTWVPWFMMLSAFILTYTKAIKVSSTSPYKPEGLKDFMSKRLRGIYPLYLAGLIADAALDAVSKNKTLSLGTPLETFAQLFLLQAWIPTITERVYQTQCWFLSAILPYWALHEVVLAQLLKWSERRLWTVLAFLTALPWFGLVALPPMIGEPLDWYRAHTPESSATALDVWVVMLKFSPAFFISTYLYGMITALLFVRYRQNPPTVFKYGATLAYISLFMIFGLIGERFPAGKLSARLGALAPLHALLLVGLSLGTDPLVKLMSHPLLSWCEELSFPQYVMQFIAINIWDGFGNPLFYTFLLAMALIANKWVYSPLHFAKAPWKTQALGVVGIFALPALCVALLVARLQFDSMQAPLQGYVEHSADMVDYRLDLKAPNIPGLDTPGSMINPSVLYHDGKLRLAVRQHYYSINETAGVFPTRDLSNANVTAVSKVTATWYSYIYTGVLDPDTLKQVGDLSPYTVKAPFRGRWGDQPWQPCMQPPTYNQQNRSISIVESIGGMEDPRLFVNTDFTSGSSTLEMTFYSNPPRNVKSEQPGDAYTLVYGEPPLQGLCTSKGRVWVSKVPQSNRNEIKARQIEREQGKTSIAEKNWMYFEADGKKQFITEVDPHTTNDFGTGAVQVSNLMISAKSSTARLTAALSSVKDVVIHGGANPVRFTSNTFLGSFHTVSTKTGVYTNFLYEFYAHYPYSIVRISRPLPLLNAPLNDASISQPMTFSSGLTMLPDGRILVSYGSSNAESRVLSLTQRGLEDLFSDSGRELMLPVECVGQWSRWSECGISSTTGRCSKQRVYHITTPASRGGVECSVSEGRVETEACSSCSSPLDVCTLPTVTWGFDISKCLDNGLGVVAANCLVSCSPPFTGEALISCPEGGQSNFQLSGCVLA